MCRSMVDIHSATAGIRRGKKKKETGQNIMSVFATQGGHNNDIVLSFTLRAYPHVSAALSTQCKRLFSVLISLPSLEVATFTYHFKTKSLATLKIRHVVHMSTRNMPPRPKRGTLGRIIAVLRT